MYDYFQFLITWLFDDLISLYYFLLHVWYEFSPSVTTTSRWLHFKGDWYIKVDTSMSNSDAKTKCIQLGGQLAIISDQNSHDAIYQLTGKPNQTT